jgi:uncharacterized membrane protein HdeD (DUF308 family)
MEAAERRASDTVEAVLGPWWLFLITGISWLLISLVLFRFDLTSVAAVGVLLGVLFLMAAVNEFALASARASWRWLHILLGILFVIGGVWCFIRPIGGAVELASILGLLLLMKGTLDLVGSIASKDWNDVWWLGLVVGILEILLAFWASQSYIGVRLEFIVLWAGFMSMFRGISEIVMAFEVRRVKRAIAP